MKRVFQILLFLSTCAGFSQARATASFTASVTIIQPIGITTTSNMNFASLDARTGGAVILTPDNNRISTGGVELADGSLVTAAAFEVTGEQDFAFSISLPEDEYILNSGSEKMVIKDFSSSLGDNTSLTGGAKTFRVGATLEVQPEQKPGIYTNAAPLSVTVNYN